MNTARLNLTSPSATLSLSLYLAIVSLALLLSLRPRFPEVPRAPVRPLSTSRRRDIRNYPARRNSLAHSHSLFARFSETPSLIRTPGSHSCHLEYESQKVHGTASLFYTHSLYTRHRSHAKTPNTTPRYPLNFGECATRRLIPAKRFSHTHTHTRTCTRNSQNGAADAPRAPLVVPRTREIPPRKPTWKNRSRRLTLSLPLSPK